MAASTHNITILGGNYAGLPIAHYLLRRTIPALEASDKSKIYKVTVVCPSSHFFFKPGAPRLVSPELASIEKAFVPIDDGFKHYSKDRFSFVQGEATDLKDDKHVITVKLTESGDTVLVPYDSLVLATGTTSNSALWTLHGSHLKTRAAFEDLLPRLLKAKSITIVGGGPAGVETAGELGAQYGFKKDITILSGGTRLLQKLRPAISEDAASYLSKLGVTVTHNLKFASSSLDETTGQTHLSLSDGRTITTDIFIDATGGTPNTSFLPRSWLTPKGYVETDVKTLRATAAGPNIYAVGDVASYSLGAIMDVNNAIAPLASTIYTDLSQSSSSPTPKQKQIFYNQIVTETQLVPIGPKGGVGALFGWRVPSWVVWAIKSRTYLFFLAKAQVMP
ncbi:MAG: hypothetical protein M1830_004708 [Pleopsidium flavum]|nr:MAG: hypothetical protein M1830_004708 [Pleopsidium flavum]